MLYPPKTQSPSPALRRPRERVEGETRTSTFESAAGYTYSSNFHFTVAQLALQNLYLILTILPLGAFQRQLQLGATFFVYLHFKGVGTLLASQDTELTQIHRCVCARGVCGLCPTHIDSVRLYNISGCVALARVAPMRGAR